jgi:hypothetical protein
MNITDRIIMKTFSEKGNFNRANAYPPGNENRTTNTVANALTIKLFLKNR